MKKTILIVLSLMMILALSGCCLSHEWEEADCVNPKTCTKCDVTEGEALGHSWVDATCEAPKTCSVCGASEGEALGHTWTDATCAQPKTCQTCHATEGEALAHNWINATLTDPKTCLACGATEGEAGLVGTVNVPELSDLEKSLGHSRGLNIRAEPKWPDGERVGTYNHEDVVTILEIKEVDGMEWGCTDKGWIVLSYVDFG